MAERKKLTPPVKKPGIDLRSRITEFNKRWNIVSDETEEFEKFRNRILAVIDNVIGEYILQQPDIARFYSFALGHNQMPKAAIGNYLDRELLISLQGKSLKDDDTYKIISATPDLSSLVTAIQALFWVLEENKCPQITQLANAVKTAVDYSPGINLRVAWKGEQVTLYPAGAKLLDEKVVNETLLWLADYPSVAKHFEEALRIYLRKDETKYRNLLDNLRFALEQIIRSILGNKKSLETQKTVLLPWLKARGAHQQIINMYDDLLARFAQYQNDAVKHGDEWSLPEIELMIYLTGTFVRFLIQLNKPVKGATTSHS